MMETVTIACRVHTGVELRLTEPRDDGTGLRQQRHIGAPVRILGPQSPGAEVVGGFALTRGVDAGFWARWVAQHEQDPLVLAGYIHGSPDAPSQE